MKIFSIILVAILLTACSKQKYITYSSNKTNDRDATEEIDFESVEVNDDTSPMIIEAEPDESSEEEIFMVCEQMPQFPGGRDSLMSYFKINLVNPESHTADSPAVRVFIKFIVEKDGSISRPYSVKEVPEDYETEALKLVQNMPKWKAGKQRGKAVRVYVILPFVFD